MAIVYAVKSGSWSDPTVWNTGTLPTASDDVYPNNFIVDINGSFTVNSIRNYPDTGISGSGYFRALNSSSLTCLATLGIVGRGDSITAAPVYRFDDNSPTAVATLNGYIQPQSAAVTSANRICVQINGAGTLFVSGTINAFNANHPSGVNVAAVVVNSGQLTVNGTLFGASSVSNGTGHAIVMNSTATNVTIVGNIYASIVFSGITLPTVIINYSTNGAVYVVGNVYGTGYFQNGSFVGSFAQATNSRAIQGPRVYITGNVYGGNNLNGATQALPGVAVDSSLFTVTGNVYGGSQFVGNLLSAYANYGIYGVGSVVGDVYGGYDATAAAVAANNGNITVTGTCYASNVAPAISTSRGVHILSGPFVAHPDGIPAVGGKFTVPNTTTSVQMSYFRGVAPAPITQFGLFDSSSFENKLPIQQNVRSGITYGLNNEKSGSIIIPQEATVLSGVTYDTNKTGSLNIAAAVWGTNVTSSFVSGSIGDRMKNVATVASTAAQIIALK